MTSPASSLSFTASNVESVVHQFYNLSSSTSTGLQTPSEVHQWLTQAQTSREAWQFSWQLLSSQCRPEVQFFGASTLATKLSKHIDEVPKEAYIQLRQQLLEQVVQPRGAHHVTTRLCVATASLLLHSVPEQWQRPITDLITNLTGNTDQLTILLQLLTVVPEEFSSLPMPSSRRLNVRHQLTESSTEVIAVVDKVLKLSQGASTLKNDTLLQAVKCFQAWAQFDLAIEVVTNMFRHLMNLVPIHKDNELFLDAVLEALGTALGLISLNSHPNAVKAMLEETVEMLEPRLNQLLQQDFDSASALSSLFITCGENHSRLLLLWALEDTSRPKNIALRLVSAILNISACNGQYPVEETLSEMTFGFWYILQDDIIACEPGQFETAVSIFGPIYRSLVESLLRKSMYPLDEAQWSGEQRELFRCYRTDVADTIMYCFNILRDDLLQLLLYHLEQAIQRQQMQQGGQTGWPYVEACLYAWSAVGEALVDSDSESESNVPSQFLSKLPSIPYENNSRVINAALDCIGGFSEWLATTPHLLPQLVPLVTAGLNDPSLALSSSMALKDLTRECGSGLRPLVGPILNACHQAITSPQLQQSECVRLMYPVAKMVALLPSEHQWQSLQPVLMPVMGQLEQLLSSRETSSEAKNKVLLALKALTPIFQALDASDDNNEKPSQDLIIMLYNQSLRLMRSIAEIWVQDRDVCDSLWVLLKQSSASTPLGGQKSLLSDTYNFMLTCYNYQSNDTALDLMRQFVVLSNSMDQESKAMTANMTCNLVQTTLKKLNQLSNLSDEQELIASLLYNMSQITKKSTATLDLDGFPLEQLISLALTALSLPETEPVKYGSSFLVSLASHSSNPLWKRHGHEVVKVAFKGAIADPGGRHIDYYADIIFALGKHAFQELTQWLQTFVHDDNFVSGTDRSHRQALAQQLLRERANKRRVVEAIKAFSAKANGLDWLANSKKDNYEDRKVMGQNNSSNS